jgi:hypothetical protein
MNDTIDRIMFTAEIQQTLSTYPGAVIGDITLKSKSEALYIQFTDVEVWDDIPVQFYESLLILSNTKGILTTNKTAKDWTEIMTEQAESEAPNRIQSLQWKISTMGGGIWCHAKTLTTDRKEWFAGPDATPETHSRKDHNILHIQVSGSQTENPQTTSELVLHILRKFDPQIRLLPPTETPQFLPHQLSMCADRNNLWNGSFIYRAANAATLPEIREQLHNTGIALPHQVIRTTTRTTTAPFHFEAPPEGEDTKNGKEGRMGGRLSSFQ